MHHAYNHNCSYINNRHEIGVQQPNLHWGSNNTTPVVIVDSDNKGKFLAQTLFSFIMSDQHDQVLQAPLNIKLPQGGLRSPGNDPRRNCRSVLYDDEDSPLLSPATPAMHKLKRPHESSSPFPHFNTGDHPVWARFALYICMVAMGKKVRGFC